MGHSGTLEVDSCNKHSLNLVTALRNGGDKSMSQKSNQTDSNTLIFQTALFIYLISSLFASSLFESMNLFATVSKGIRYTAYLLLAWNIIQSNRYNSGQLIKYGVGVLISLISYRVTGEKQLIFLMLFLMAVANICFTKVLQTYLWANGTGMLTIFAAYKTGLIPDRIYGISRCRHSLGYGYPTTVSNYWLYFILVYIAYRKERLTITEGIILEGINYYFFLMTDTRNAFAVSTLALVAAYGLRLWKGKHGRKLLSFSIQYMALLGTICISTLTFLWNQGGTVITELNYLLSNRLRFSYEGFQNYGLRLFGQRIEWVGGTRDFSTVYKEYNYVDSSYLQIVLTYGIVVLLLLIITYTLLGKEIVRAQDWYLGITMVMGALHSIFDPQFLWMQYNIFLLALGYLLISNREERNEYLFQLRKEGPCNGTK